MRAEATAAPAFQLTVRLPEPLRQGREETIVINEPVSTLGELVRLLERRIEGFSAANDELFNFALNGELVLHGERLVTLKSGDEVEIVIAFSGG
jgi:molybdopterin converting factor small subunit